MPQFYSRAVARKTGKATGKAVSTGPDIQTVAIGTTRPEPVGTGFCKDRIDNPGAPGWYSRASVHLLVAIPGS